MSMREADTLHCPVCRARFRENRQCPRCGADLKPLMTLVLKNNIACEDARTAILNGNYKAALTLASAAQTLYRTERSKRLFHLASWLAQ